MFNIIFKDESSFINLKEVFKKSGLENIHILADFDSTLTKAFDNGKKIPGIFQIIIEHNLLGDDYTNNGKILFEKYYPIEVNPNISIEDKVNFMQEWWEKVFDALLKYGYNLELSNYISINSFTKLRDGYKDFFDFLSENNVPLVVMSAAGVGTDAIEKFFKYNLNNTSNIQIISNVFLRDSKGNMIGYKKPLIHAFNKAETLVENYPEIHNIVEKRKNVILLGDSLGDHHMIDGFEYNNLLKIGFLNFNESELLDEYLKRYDVIITGDGDMSFINNFLKECF